MPWVLTLRKIAADVTGKTLEEVKQHYELLVDDVNLIESGRVTLPTYNSTSEGSTGNASDEGAGKKGGQPWNSNESNNGSKASRSDQERHKGIAWTEDEHSNEARVNGYGSSEQCEYSPELAPRPHSVSILEFGAVGDGKTLNTIAFQNAIFYLMSFADKGGTQLYVPPGQWLTGSFNLTSHLTLFLERGAVIIGFQDPFYWEVINLLPSCGQGIKAPAGRYLSLINGYMLNDVVITGNTGTIDGVGSIWWRSFTSHSLNYSRPHLIKLVASNSVVVSNITFLNTLTYGIHSVYCSNVHIHNISISAPSESPFTVGIVPDSSDNVCIEDCTISMGFDAIALKSGWDEYVEHVHLYNSKTGIVFRTTRGRGGYMKEIVISDIVILKNMTGTRFSINLFFARRLLDLAGYGVAVAVSKEFKGSFRGLTYKSPLLDLMIKSGRNGKNNGKGYYFYEKGSKPKPDLSILPIVEESRRLANIMPGGKPIFITDQEIVEMILFLIVNEACRVLDEGMVIQASDLDIACGLGMSFPSYSVFSDVFDEKIFKNLEVGSRARKHFTSWSGVG
ncbi:putative polygalacturonase [Arachis hypogaea]|nr:putative polygalacturonase [Arachis hypogaea]